MYQSKSVRSFVKVTTSCLAGAVYAICFLLWWKWVLILSVAGLLFGAGYGVTNFRVYRHTRQLRIARQVLDAERQALEERRRVRHSMFTARRAMRERAMHWPPTTSTDFTQKGQ
ncbi:MAG: hypothetical protein ACRCYU_14895 [Nocardioides sp.]